RAVAIDPQNPDAHRARAGILMIRSRFEAAIEAVREAVACGPNLPDVLDFASFVLAGCGRAAEGIPLVRKAMSLSPTYPANYLGSLGNVLRLAGRGEEAIEAFRAYHAASPGFGLVDIAMIEAQFTITGWARTQLRSDTEQMAADIESLRAAG